MNVFFILLISVLFLLILCDIKSALDENRQNILIEIDILKDISNIYKQMNNELDIMRIDIENMQKLYLSDIRHKTKKD